eukprot:Em0009g1105a
MFTGRIEIDDIPKIAGHLPSWTLVATKLDMSEEDIQEIQASSKVAANQRKEFLKLWSIRDPAEATYERLCTVLVQLGEKEKVVNKHSSTEFRVSRFLNIADNQPEVFWELRDLRPLHGTGLTIAFLDTGINKHHQDFTDKIKVARSFVDPSSTDSDGLDPSSTHSDGHGTTCAEVYFPEQMMGDVLCIRAHDKYGKPSQFSPRGRELAFLAPGERIWAPSYTDTFSLTYAENGTSYSAPAVAGLICLTLQHLKGIDHGLYEKAHNIEMITKILETLSSDTFDQKQGTTPSFISSTASPPSATTPLQPPPNYPPHQVNSACAELSTGPHPLNDQDQELDGMAGALARALAQRSTALQNSDDEDDDAGGDEEDEDEWSE